MKFHKNKDLLEKLLFLKAIGYNFIDENFLNLSKYQDYNSIDELNSEIKKCSLCFLRNSSKCVFTGFGDKNSKIMFVSICKKDDYFEGASGKILENAINNGLN